MRIELVLLSSNQAVPLSEAPLQLGRGPSNHVVIADDTVSWNHAQLWVEAGRVWVRDLGSRNGTYVNGTRVRGATPVEAADQLQFGLNQKASLRVPFGDLESDSIRVLKLEEVATGVQFMLQGNRFHIGSGPDAHLRIEGAPARAATLLLHEDDELWVGTADEEFQVEVDQVFTVAGRSMRIVRAAVDHVPTVEQGLVRYPYDARVIANGPRGPEVHVSGPAGLKHQCEGNRAILLLLLARAVVRDREADVDEDEEGWVSDEDVRTGIWGRGKGTKSGLNVLVHRTRKQLESDGFDPWFIEKKRRGIRARLRKVDEEA